MSDAFDEWVNLLVKQYRAEVRKDVDGYRIDSSSKEWKDLVGMERPVALTSTPDSEVDWRNRLLLVEKSVARALSLTPVGFSCRVIDAVVESNAEVDDVTILRLAYGFSLSIGRCLRQRFTAYYVVELDETFYVCGEDDLYDLNYQIQELDLEIQAFKRGLLPLLAKVQETQQAYCSHNSVKTELNNLQISLLRQLRDLDRLYTVNYGQYAKLYGRASASLRGEDAIEAEYIDKMEDIFHRHQPTIIFEPLTLGVIYCKVSIRSHGASSEIQFPFNRDKSFRYKN